MESLDFSDIALAKLLQSAPELSPMVLNFSEIQEGVDVEGVKVGVFTLQTGAGIVFVPVVAKGETVYPLDSVFLDAEKRFMPLTQATTNKLKTSSNFEFGQSKNMPKSVPPNPDMSTLMIPPRTGKFVYASTSRLTEFLAALPEHLKTFAFEKFASEQSVYNALDGMFGLKAVISVLKAAKPRPADEVPSQFSVITSPREVADLHSQALTADYVKNGFIVQGESPVSRVAVTYDSFDQNGTFTSVDPATDGGKDYTVVFKDGGYMQAYLPRYREENPVKPNGLVSILEDGSYVRGPVVVAGNPQPNPEVLTALFKNQPPCLLKDCYNDDTVLLVTNSGEFLGPFAVRSVVMTGGGIDVKVGGMSGLDNIHASRNLKHDVDIIGKTMYVQYNIIVIKLGEDRTYDMEQSQNRAYDRRQLITSQYLGAELDLRHDGVEFTMNHEVLGGLPDALKVLVEREHLDPDVGYNFLKKAEDEKYVKIFLTKQAVAGPSAPTEVPTYGNRPDDSGNVSLAGAFMPAVASAGKLNDAQVTEATIISQLLQVPDLFEMINEYLPEINTAVDKLGRVLFLSRVKIDQLAEPLDSDAVFALISQIKNVYRQLGDSSTKLEQIANVSANFSTKAGTPETNGV